MFVTDAKGKQKPYVASVAIHSDNVTNGSTQRTCLQAQHNNACRCVTGRRALASDEAQPTA